MMKHLILTRFAVAWPGLIVTRDNDEWLADRYRLLEKYTIPSLEAQTCKDFKWLILADPNFPGLDRARLERYADVLWTSTPWDRTHYGRVLVDPKVIRPYTSGTDWLLTTRLDSDDIISNTFVQRLQGAFVEREMWYGFPCGFIGLEGTVYARRYPKSPFVSYGEPAENAKTVYWIEHRQAGRLNREPAEGQCRHGEHLLEVDSDPAWLQVDHGGNVNNNVLKLQQTGNISIEAADSSLLASFGGIYTDD